mgnify:CR=1 FL=1
MILQVSIDKPVDLPLRILSQLRTPVTVKYTHRIRIHRLQLLVYYTVLAWSIRLVLHTFDSLLDIILFER